MPTGIYKRIRPVSDETKKKISDALIGRVSPRRGMKLQPLSENHKEKLRIAHLGNRPSEETKKKMSETQKRIGNRPPSNLGKSHLEITKNKIRNKVLSVWKDDNFRDKMTGENANNWLGGKSFEPYTTDWTKTLRRAIRERDYYTCQVCKEPQGDRAPSIHHIDYNKNNCNPNNLVSLCLGCHMRTNYNRDSWIKYFYEKTL
jgi:hypothetical protein